MDEWWAEVETALPEGWTEIIVWWHPDRATARAIGPNESDDRYHPSYQEIEGRGATVAAALHALAVRLREPVP